MVLHVIRIDEAGVRFSLGPPLRPQITAGYAVQAPVEAGKKFKKPQAYLSKIERGVDVVELGELAKVYKKLIDYFI